MRLGQVYPLYIGLIFCNFLIFTEQASVKKELKKLKKVVESLQTTVEVLEAKNQVSEDKIETLEDEIVDLNQAQDGIEANAWFKFGPWSEWTNCTEFEPGKLSRQRYRQCYGLNCLALKDFDDHVSDLDTEEDDKSCAKPLSKVMLFKFNESQIIDLKDQTFACQPSFVLPNDMGSGTKAFEFIDDNHFIHCDYGWCRIFNQTDFLKPLFVSHRM